MLKRKLVSNGAPVNLAEVLLDMPPAASVTLTAAGTNLATALVLSESFNVVTTAAASTGVALPVMEVGDKVTVVNLGANALLVYPPATDSIQTGAAGVAFSIAVGKTAEFTRVSLTKIVAILSA